MSTIRSLARPVARIRACSKFSSSSSASFHSSPVSAKRITRDRNPERGVSPLHRQPQREPLGAAKYGIPEPVAKEDLPKVETDADHGLWGFFRDKKALSTPEEDHQHGRCWTVEELRHKSWEDLHKLWWVCLKEKNIVATQEQERKRLKPGYGDYEAGERLKQVKLTMRNIKYTLTERYHAWEEARKLAQDDPEVDLSGNGPAYVPGDFEEGEELLEETPAATPQVEKQA